MRESCPHIKIKPLTLPKPFSHSLKRLNPHTSPNGLQNIFFGIFAAYVNKANHIHAVAIPTLAKDFASYHNLYRRRFFINALKISACDVLTTFNTKMLQILLLPLSNASNIKELKGLFSIFRFKDNLFGIALYPTRLNHRSFFSIKNFFS